MDFRTCPTCQASVLEDDVADCPFCGASMSGKPKPAAPKQAAPKPAAPNGGKPAAPGGAKAPIAPAGPKPGGPAAGPGKPGGAVPPRRQRTDPEVPQEDPFDVDTTAVRRAVKLAPRMTKQRTHEVVCPMCETHGFMTPEDAGKDVQCANAECIVPVFKSKRLVVQEAAPEKPPRNWLLIISGGLLLALVLGGAWFMLQGPPDQPDPGPQPKFVNENQIDPSGLVPRENIRVTVQEKPPATPAEIRQQSLAKIVDAARPRDGNRNADVGTQITVETFALAGDLTQAKQALERLQGNARAAKYYQIAALVEVGWQQLKEGDEAGLKKSLDDAVALTTPPLPSTIRQTHDAAISLAALLIAAGRTPEAQTLIDKSVDYDLRGELSVLWRTALESGSYNVLQEADYPWHAVMPDPLRIGVVETLVLRGHGSKALEYVQSLTGVVTKEATLAAWAGRMLLTGAGDAATISPEFSKTGSLPAGACRGWCALAAAALQRDDKAAAEQHLLEASKLLESLTPAAPPPMPGMRELYQNGKNPRAGLPDPGPAHAQALAAMDVAVVRLKLEHSEAAWTAFQKSYELARGMSPSAVETRKLLEEFRNRDRVQSQLAAQFRLDATAARLAVSEYQGYCTKLDQEATARLTLQGRFLKRAARAGLLPQVWALVQQASSQRLEPLLDAPEPILGTLLAQAKARENSELETQITAALGDRRVVPDALELAAAQVQQLAQAGKFSAAIEALKAAARTDAANKQAVKLDAMCLLLLGRMQPAANLGELLTTVQGLPDPVMREDCFLLLAATAARRGFAAELWKFAAESKDLKSLEIVSLYRGFVSAIPAQ